MSPRPSIADVRLVAVDLDGTLLRSDLTVSSRARTAIAALRASGTEIVIATARSPRSVREIARKAGVGGVAVCANGAIDYDLDRAEILRHVALPPHLAHRLIEGLRERVAGVVFGWELELRFGSEPAYEAVRDPRWPRPRDSYPPCEPLTWTRPMTKLLARAPGADLEGVLGIARELAGTEASATLAGNVFVELAAPGVGKEHALAALAAERGIPATQTMAIGDQLTDLGMICWAGVGVAVGNAHPAVIAAADEVTGTNDGDGVASVLERLLDVSAEVSQPSRSESVGA